MRDPLVKVLRDFFTFENPLDPDKPVLLGFSGGVDSSALLSLFRECQFLKLNVFVVHFDHAWREESLTESLVLKNAVESMGFPFYFARSQGPALSNKEEQAREERYSFFKKVYLEVGAQALILAHQREDQAETVLKRIFEGASVFSCGGMSRCSFYQGMRILRPLLEVSRESLLAWNEKNQVSYLIDYTNKDLHFLRPRIREKLFPEMEKWFGKNVQKNLVEIGKEISLLKSAMQRRIGLLLGKKTEGALGFYLPVTELQIEDPLERQELVRLALKEKGAFLGRKALVLIDSLLQEGSIDKSIDVDFGEIIVDRGRVFWFFDLLPSCPLEGDLLVGSLFGSFGLWCFEVETVEKVSVANPLLFAFMQGELIYQIPLDSTSSQMVSYDNLCKEDRKKISSFFSKNKVPSKMKRVFPFLMNKGMLIDLNFVFYIHLNKWCDGKFLTIRCKKMLN